MNGVSLWSNISGSVGMSFSTFFSSIGNVLLDFKIADLIDIVVLALIFYGLIQIINQTHVGQLLKGIVILFLAAAVSGIFNMRALNYLISKVLQFGVLALVIIFQPEIRHALERMGNSNLILTLLNKPKTQSEKDRDEWRNAIATVCDACEQMSDSRTGALIVFERENNLDDIIKTGTELNCDITVETIGTIFYEGTPLHDGAVVVRNARIKAAGCVLPLSANLDMGKDMGTRHRAGLGMCEKSDAVVVVVSEETGIISVGKKGVLIRRLDRQNLYNQLQMELVPEISAEEENKSYFARLIENIKKEAAQDDEED